MTTVADIIEATPGLKTRAKAAHFARQEATALEHARQFEGLIEETLTFLHQDLGIPQRDLSDVEFKEAPRENNFPVAVFNCCGLWFRASYVKNVIKVDSSNSYDQIDLRMQMTLAPKPAAVNTAWLLIKDLADIGKVLP